MAGLSEVCMLMTVGLDEGVKRGCQCAITNGEQ